MDEKTLDGAVERFDMALQDFKGTQTFRSHRLVPNKCVFSANKLADGCLRNFKSILATFYEVWILQQRYQTIKESN